MPPECSICEYQLWKPPRISDSTSFGDDSARDWSGAFRFDTSRSWHAAPPSASTSRTASFDVLMVVSSEADVEVEREVAEIRIVEAVVRIRCIADFRIEAVVVRECQQIASHHAD